MTERGYRGLDIYQLAHTLAVDIHRMSLMLPKHETYEEGSQIRRSSKSVSAQIVEGYCLRKNKREFVQYLNRAYASAHETVEHLDLLFESGSLNDKATYESLRSQYDSLCKMIFRFMESAMIGHEKPLFVREESGGYPEEQPASHIPNPKSV